MDKDELTRQVMSRLEKLGLQAVVEGNGDISLSVLSRETGNRICLPPEEMEDLLDRACEIGLRSLPDGVLETTIVSLFNIDNAGR